VININIIRTATVWADGIYLDLSFREIGAHLVRIRIGLVATAPGTEPGATLVTYTFGTYIHGRILFLYCSVCEFSSLLGSSSPLNLIIAMIIIMATITTRVSIIMTMMMAIVISVFMS
jgi:hypothetical protein